MEPTEAPIVTDDEEADLDDDDSEIDYGGGNASAMPATERISTVTIRANLRASWEWNELTTAEQAERNSYERLLAKHTRNELDEACIDAAYAEWMARERQREATG